jgi:hypothetical protein
MLNPLFVEDDVCPEEINQDEIATIEEELRRLSDECRH